MATQYHMYIPCSTETMGRKKVHHNPCVVCKNVFHTICALVLDFAAVVVFINAWSALMLRLFLLNQTNKKLIKLMIIIFCELGVRQNNWILLVKIANRKQLEEKIKIQTENIF